MVSEVLSATQQEEPTSPRPEVNRYERHRLIAHLGRTFARRYDLSVIPYDAQSAQQMSLEEITTLLHHEAGHARYTAYRLMIEGQRQAHDQGYLPTSFWLTFEGIEDPRVNSLEGEESPAIDRQIRVNQGKDLAKRITEMPLAKRPRMLQFAYESFHRWLHGEGIPELVQTEVGQAAERAAPLLVQYFQNTDVEGRKVLQEQIWEIARGLEKKDIEDEEKRQVHEQQNQRGGQKMNQGSQGQGQQGEGQSSGSGQGKQGGQGEGQPSAGMPNIPGGKGLLEKLKGLFGRKSSPPNASQTPQGEGQEGNEQGGAQPRPNRADLSKLTPEEMRQIQEAIDQLTPQQRAQLTKKAREAIDELQKEALEEGFNKTFRLVKNKQTGEYEVRPILAGEKAQQEAKENYQRILQEVLEEEQAQWEREEAQRRQQEEELRQLEEERREKLEMARKQLIFYNELFSRISREFGYIRYANYAFSDNVLELKGYDQDYESPQRYDWGGGIKSTIKACLMQALRVQGGTNMLPAIQKAVQDLNEETFEYPDYASALYFMGDGGDTCGNTRNIREFLRLREAQRGFGEHLLSAIMLGDESQRQALADIFGGEHTTVAPDFKTLIEQSMYRFDEDMEAYLRDKTV